VSEGAKRGKTTVKAAQSGHCIRNFSRLANGYFSRPLGALAV